MKSGSKYIVTAFYYKYILNKKKFWVSFFEFRKIKFKSFKDSFGSTYMK